MALFSVNEMLIFSGKWRIRGITDIRTATLNKKGAGYLDEGPVNFKKGAGCF
ncbi:unknown [Prevotella sp. CAG:617]|jgi:hypothetical protein|nr:unknown [Prevotella sp. CAG:617]